ncbi:MAG: hypothetical protein HOE90_22235 [Bacteriovoracaceae bacterium]|jgi:hypothetical protein|nr:hypothetical protein [Bacteriovoracaceae bacterium]
MKLKKFIAFVLVCLYCGSTFADCDEQGLNQRILFIGSNLDVYRARLPYVNIDDFKAEVHLIFGNGEDNSPTQICFEYSGQFSGDPEHEYYGSIVTEVHDFDKLTRKSGYNLGVSGFLNFLNLKATILPESSDLNGYRLQLSFPGVVSGLGGIPSLSEYQTFNYLLSANDDGYGNWYLRDSEKQKFEEVFLRFENQKHRKILEHVTVITAQDYERGEFSPDPRFGSSFHLQGSFPIYQ